MSQGNSPRRPLPASRAVDAAGVAACALLLGLAYLVGLAPRLRERAEAVQQRADLEMGRQEVARLEDERRALQARAADLESKLASGPLRPSRASEVNGRVQAIVELAEQCGLRISQLSPGSPVPGDRFVVVPLKARGTGGYAALTSLISTLHERFPDTAVAALTLTGSAAGDATPEFSVEFAWYTAPDGTTVTAAPEPRT